MTNIVILTGNIGNDAETTTTAGGIMITNLSVATSHPLYADGKIVRDEDGRARLVTDWHRVVAFDNKRAQKCVKGMKVLVIGRNKTNKWQDRDGNDRYTTEVIVKSIEHLAWPKRQNEDIDPDDLDDEIPE